MKDYLQIMFSAFELELSFAILRCQDGLDLSDHFAPEEELGNEKKLEAVEKGGDEEEDQENRDHEEGGSNANSKPSIWMVSTQVVFSITYINMIYIHQSLVLVMNLYYIQGPLLFVLFLLYFIRFFQLSRLTRRDWTARW